MRLRRNGYIERGTSTCASRKSPPSVRPLVGWLVYSQAMHYIMAAWRQVSQQTIQNCFRKAGHKYQSDGNENAKDDDFGQDWEELCRAQ